jgi:quinol-cytochrome oxidoreductase complex cytochrome b subunit
VSGATLSRFFALHVIVLPWVAFVLLGYHFTLVRRRGIAPPMTEASERPRWRKSGLFSPEDEPEDGIPFFPNHLLRSFIVGTLTLAVTVTLAIIWPRAVAPPADPSGLPDRLVSTWVPVDVSLALIRLIGPWGLAAFLVLGVSLILIPLVDRGPERQLRRRPVVAAVGLTFFVGYVVLFAIGRVIGSVPPSGDLRQHGTSEQAVPTGPDALVPLPEPAGSEESVESAPPDVRGGER